MQNFSTIPIKSQTEVNLLNNSILPPVCELPTRDFVILNKQKDVVNPFQGRATRYLKEYMKNKHKVQRPSIENLKREHYASDLPEKMRVDVNKVTSDQSCEIQSSNLILPTMTKERSPLVKKLIKSGSKPTPIVNVKDGFIDERPYQYIRTFELNNKNYTTLKPRLSRSSVKL